MKIIDVTLLGINMGNISPMIKILDQTLDTVNNHFNFKKSVLLSDKNVKHQIHEIKKIPKLNNFDQLNLFCIQSLWRYIDTPHYLIVQPDGYIINPHKWNDKWLNYDYIGAPWDDPIMKDKFGYPAIGNGGFSLRNLEFSKFISKKHMLANLAYNEDGYYSNALNRESHLKYPSLKEALEFSQEEIIDENIEPFGLHGAPKSKAYKYWILNNKNNV